VAKDKNNIGIVDSNRELVNKDILAISIIPIKKEAVLDSTILVNPYYISKDVEDGADML
jgi:hypothetical protein